MSDNPNKKGKQDWSKVSQQPWELQFDADKFDVSIQQVIVAKRATGSVQRNVVEKYIKDKLKK